MSSDGSLLVGYVARSAEIDRSVVQTPRTADNAQAQLAAEHKAVGENKKTQSTEHLNRDKVRRERDQRRRQMEKHSQNYPNRDNEEEGHSLDLIA